MTLDGVLAWLERGGGDDVTRALVNLTESDRKALGPKARGWLTRGNPTRIPSNHAALAVLATADGWRQAMVATTHGFGFERSEFFECASAILKARDPGWLPEFVTGLLDDGGTWNWCLVRSLVRADAVAKPDHPEYYRGTVRGVPDYTRDRRPLIDRLDADPGLIGNHLLGMVSTEGTGRLLAYHDKFEEGAHYVSDSAAMAARTWRVTLLVLSQEERLDRGRLLDAVLAAPLRDWASADLAWYVGMHDALAPTLDEIAERQGTYVRLLTVEHGPSVKLAQRELLRLMPDPRFEAEPFLAASQAALGRSDKATVSAHLRLLEKLAKAHRNVSITDTVRIASEHTRADVRDQAAKILARLGAEPTRPAVGPRFVAVDPEVRPPAPRLEPVGSADELAEVLLGLLEEIDAVELERAIDGLLRLADERPATADLLLSRATAADLYDGDPRIAARILACAWLLPRARVRDGYWSVVLGATGFPSVPAATETFVGAIGRRLTEIAHAVQGGGHVSVALPTSADFSLDATELNRRLREVRRSRPIHEMELLIALLRVPTGARASVVVPRSLRKSRAIAQARAGRVPSWSRHVALDQRSSWEPERRIPLFRDDHEEGTGAATGILARSTPERTVGAETTYGEYIPRFEQTLGLGAALLPHDHDVLAAHAHPYLHRDLRKDRACSVPVIDAIARARSSNGPPSSSAIVLALAAQDARGRTAAQDAVLDLARYGVLDGHELGRQTALLLTDDIVVGQRISSGLTECARAGDAAVLPILDALQEIVRILPDRRDAGAFLELAADLVERTGRTIELPTEFGELAAGKATSMVAKAARRLLKP
ncbi:DUF6493 family protein [Aeromicrobium sp.]|uniref:DUF6493 family protein n=1 Tax=Aeromicrobium sp. TaxID=1871063 RepID=UPI002FC9DC2C